MSFSDSLSVTGYDPRHSDEEDRFLTMGMSVDGRLLLVSHTDQVDAVRIISAREASRRERKDYEDGNFPELLSNVVDEVVSQAATLGRMMPSWNLVSLATSMRCIAASRVRQWCEADSASLKSIVSVALRVPLPLVRR